MMDDERVKGALRAVGRLAIERLRGDAALRDALRALLDAMSPPAQGDAAATSHASAALPSTPTSAPPTPAAHPPTPTPSPPVTPSVNVVPLPPLTFGAERPASPLIRGPAIVADAPRPGDGGEDREEREVLARMIARLDARAGHLRANGELGEDDFPQADPADRTLIAHGFANVAASLRLVVQTADQSGRGGMAYQQAIELVAESLSALRIAFGRVADYADVDHTSTFNWLRQETKSKAIYVARYMRLDDPADPTQWQSLADRIAALARPFAMDKQRRQGLAKLRYHVGRLRTDSTPARPLADDELGEWRRAVGVTVDLISGGLQPSNVELRAIWIDAIDALPEELVVPPEFDWVVREVERHLASIDADDGAAEQRDHGPTSATVLAVREVLRGRSIVVIGGEARRHAVERLIEAFELSDVDWVATRAHESHYAFEPSIRRPGVAVVLLLIRFISHGFAEVQTFCDDANVPLVRVRAGYHPNAVAAAILDQAGDRIALAAS